MILDIVSPLAKGIPTGKADYYVLTIIITQLKQGATLIRRILRTGPGTHQLLLTAHPCTVASLITGQAGQALFPVCRQAGIVPIFNYSPDMYRDEA